MSDLSNKCVLVTGGAGFIGSHLVDGLLRAGASRVVAVDNFFLGRLENLSDAMKEPDRFVLYREDAADPYAMEAVCRKERVQVVYNLATKALKYSFLNPEGAFTVNTQLAQTWLNLLKNGRIETLIHLSSSEVYGTAQAFPMTESHPMHPTTPYAAGKAAADLMVESFWNVLDLDAVILRPFNNYGPRQNDADLAAIIPLTARRIRAGLPPILEGDGGQTRDFIHVSDTVRALLLAYDRKECRRTVVNLGSGRETRILDLLHAIADCMGFTGDFEQHPARQADVRRHCAGSERAHALLGFEPAVDIREGIRSTIDWYLGRGL